MEKMNHYACHEEFNRNSRQQESRLRGLDVLHTFGTSESRKLCHLHLPNFMLSLFVKILVLFLFTLVRSVVIGLNNVARSSK
jgi:hypothetical protein